MWTCQHCGHVTEDELNRYCGRCGRPREGGGDDGYTLYLHGFDRAHLISVIKTVREITHLGLKEAKDLVEAAPCPVLTNLSRDAAERLAQQLRDAGAIAEACPAGVIPSTPTPLPGSSRPKPSTGCAGVLLLNVLLLIWVVCQR